MQEPKNPDFEARIRRSVPKQPLLQTLGVELHDVQLGAVSFSLEHHEAVTQQHGFVHGGAVGAILDSTCGYSAVTMMPKEAEVLTVEFKTNFLAPCLGERYIFRGSVIKPGRTLVITEAKAYAINDGNEKLVAIMTATMMTVIGRDDVKQRETNYQEA